MLILKVFLLKRRSIKDNPNSFLYQVIEAGSENIRKDTIELASVEVPTRNVSLEVAEDTQIYIFNNDKQNDAPWSIGNWIAGKFFRTSKKVYW